MIYEQVKLSHVPEWAREVADAYLDMGATGGRGRNRPGILRIPVQSPTDQDESFEASLSRSGGIFCTRCATQILGDADYHPAYFEVDQPPTAFTLGLCDDCWALEELSSDGSEG